jgi:hypothetical protein
MIHNRKKYFFLFFFPILIISCKTFVTSDIEKKKFLEIFTGDYYQKAKVLNSNNFFEKPSSQYKYLVIRPGEGPTVKVKEIEVYFYSYTNKFLGEVNSLFSEKAPPKFTIYEKVKYGEGKRSKDSADLEVEYTNFSIRNSQSSDLLGGLEKFINRKTEAQQLFHEKVIYTITPDEGLWKLEESELKDGQEAIRWKHYPSGTPARNYPYSEFAPNKNTLEYSRIYAFEDYSYKKIFKDIPSGSKLYNNKEFVIYYFPGEKLDPVDENLIYAKNKQLTLYKMDLPLIIFKKKESTAE